MKLKIEPLCSFFTALSLVLVTFADVVREAPPAAPYAPPTDYGWRPPAWKLTPDAAALVQEWNKTPYTPKNGRTAFIVRAQLKYGINRNDYIHGWYDRPLLQDSALGQRIDSPTEKKPWLNPDSWRKTVEMERLGKQDAFAVFTCTSSRDQVIPLSQKQGSEATILVELTRGLKIEECLKRAKQALDMPNSFRLGGKVVLTSYPQIGENDLPHYAKLKEALVSTYGDRFLLMPYFSLFGGDKTSGTFDAKRLLAIRARLEKALRVLDGLCQSSRDSYVNRRYDPWLCDNVMAPVVRGVFAEPEFKGKYLAWWATPGHENSYRWNYGLDSTGTRMLRDTLRSIVRIHPDFFVGAEWDEENENTCFRPMVAHGFTHQRLLRFFSDAVNNGGKFDVFPGDDTAIPNLVLSYRKELMAGEPFEAEVLNIPDGTFTGEDITVGFALKRPDGTVARAFAPQRLKGGALGAAWFREDVSKLVADAALMPELTVWAKGEKRVFSNGFWPVGLHTMRCIEYKWTKQPIRDLPNEIAGGLSVGAADANGVVTVQGSVKSARRLRSIAVLDENDTVYMYDKTKEGTRDLSTLRIRIAFGGYASNGKNHWLKGRIDLAGASHAALRVGRTRGDIAVDGQGFAFMGAMLNNWPHTLFVEIPSAEAETGVFTVNLPGFFTGTVAVKDLLTKEVMAIAGPRGSNLFFTLFRSQASIPVPQFVNAANFAFRLKPGLKNSVLRMETVDEDYHVWRSAPFCCGASTANAKITYNVYERDADTVSAVTVDAARFEPMTYVFEPSRGSVVACGARNLWGVLGGPSTYVCGFGWGESQYGNAGALYVNAKTPNVAKSAPDYVREPDGSWALQFGAASYVSLPQQVWPVEAGFALDLVVKPTDVMTRQGLLATGPTSSSLWIEKGRVYAKFFQRNLFVKKSGHAATVIVKGPEIAPGKWQTVRLVCDQKTAHLEVDGVGGAAVPVSGDLFYPQYTAVGVDEKGCFFTGRMKGLSVRPQPGASVSETRASGSEPKISVFAKFIRNIARQRGVSLAAAANMLYDLGVRGYDCGPGEKDLDELAATKLKPINFYYFPDWFNRRTDPNARITTDECLRRAVRYGIPRIMTIPPHFTPGGDEEAEMVRIVGEFRKFVADAKARGITVTIEDFGGTNNACSHAKYLKRLLDEVPDLRYALDSGNLHYAGRGESIIDMMNYAKGRIAHVHLKDLEEKANRSYVSLGLGAVPNEQVVRTTRAWGYDGWYTLENPVGDDTYLDTARQVAVLKSWLGAFDIRSELRRAAAGGGRVVVPPGEWRTGPLELGSNVELHLEEGARLVFPDEPSLYPMRPGLVAGHDEARPSPLVGAFGATNVSVTGRGTFVAETGYWMENRKTVPRPCFFQFVDCAKVRLEDIRIRNSPSWTMHFVRTDGVVVRGVDSRARECNNDGIDLDSVDGALIENCTLDQGDDAICMKSGKNAAGRARNRPTRNVVIRNCTVVNGHTLLGIGSELSGGIENVTLENCKVLGEVWRILLVKTNRARGGFARNVAVRNVEAARAKCAIFGIMSDYAAAKPENQVATPLPTSIEDITVENVTCDEAWYAYELNGDALLPPRRITMRNCRVKKPSRGTGHAENIQDQKLENVVAEPASFSVWCDDPDSRYQCGAEATFTVVSALTNGLAHVRLDNFGDRVLSEFDVDLATQRVFTVKGTRQIPGFLLLTVKCGKTEKRWGASFDAMRIEAGAPCPPDFESFWRQAIADYDRTVPEDVKLTALPALSTNEHDVFELTLTDPKGRTVGGFISIPKDCAQGPFPVHVTVPGAGPCEGYPLCPKGKIGLRMNVHYWQAIPGAAKRGAAHNALQKKEDAEWQKRYPVKGTGRYTLSGIAASREEYYYYGAILAINRSVNWLRKRPEAKADDFVYSGGSQGGGMGLALVALNGGFRRASIIVPALTAHLCQKIDGREAGWPRLVSSQLPENVAAAERNAPYFDGVNFASLITCPIRFAVGYVDTVAPPHAGYAAFNACPSKDKAILESVGFGHAISPVESGELTRWMALAYESDKSAYCQKLKWETAGRREAAERDAPKRSVGQVAEGDREAMRQHPRESPSRRR